MDNMITLGIEKYKFFMFENESSLLLLKIQDTEINKWGKFLDEWINKIESLKLDSLTTSTDLLFKKDLTKIRDEIQGLDDLLDLQQKRLENDLKFNIEDDLEAYMIQDILREKTKSIEISLIELKYKFMVYISTAH